jgi:hypothetical protein
MRALSALKAASSRAVTVVAVVADEAVLTVVADVADVAEVAVVWDVMLSIAKSVPLLVEGSLVTEVADVAEVAVVAEETPREESSMLSVVCVAPMVAVWGSLLSSPTKTTTCTLVPLVRLGMV